MLLTSLVKRTDMQGEKTEHFAAIFFADLMVGVETITTGDEQPSRAAGDLSTSRRLIMLLLLQKESSQQQAHLQILMNRLKHHTHLMLSFLSN